MTADIIDLASRPERAPRHSWGPRVSVLENTPSGCEQGEKTCIHCGLVRVTVHPPRGLPWREWRGRDGRQVAVSSTPPCIAEPIK